MTAAVESPRTATPPQTVITPAADTERANRAAALATYLNACRNVGAVPDPVMLEEHGRLTDYTEIDVRDDHLVIEAQVESGTLGWTSKDGVDPASATLIANGMFAVELTFRGDGMPTVVLENLHDAQLLVQVEDGTNQMLYRGLIESA